MDYKFPQQLFPHFYLDGPPNLKWTHDYGGQGSYERLLETTRASFQTGVEEEFPHRFQPQHMVDGEVWVPTEPIVTPLLSPSPGTEEFCGQPVSPDAFFEHMQYYYVEHCMDAFSVMGRLLGEHFTFSRGQHHKEAARVSNMKKFLNNLNKKKCELQHSFRANQYHHLLGDIIPDIPSSLLAELLHEELRHQEELEYFQPVTTGGALACLPSLECENETFLIYPSGESLSTINFHPMGLEFSKDKPPVVSVAETPLFFKLTGPVRQVSVAQVDDVGLIGLRSDYFCSAWLLRKSQRPCPAEVVQLKERATSLNVSPHVSDQLVVASESGAAYLWVLEKGLQKIRDEKTNLYFNAKSAWRCCDFTAHPCITVFADRTGAELTDLRSKDCHTLFRISGTADCKSGERVVLSKYLPQSHAFHHLITTQFSAYLLDERMPCVPAVKWEHMMETPPCFTHALGEGNNSKILLGAQRAQETMLLQYSGGLDESCSCMTLHMFTKSGHVLSRLEWKNSSVLFRALTFTPTECLCEQLECRLPPGMQAPSLDISGREWSCQAAGPIQKLYSPCESLKTRQLPHRHHKAKVRLASHAAGLSAVQHNGYLCVLQLTEAGDIFYQMLRHIDPANSKPYQSDSAEPAANTKSAIQPQDSFEEYCNFKTERIQHILDSDNEDGSHTADENGVRPPAEEGINSKVASVLKSSLPSSKRDCAHLLRPAIPKMASSHLKLIWKKWLESFLTCNVENNSYWKHWEIPTSDVIKFKVQQRDKLAEDKFQRLRKDLADIPKSRKLLVHGVTYLPPLEVTQVPDGVIPEDWQDDLSQRLRASWMDGWSSWWDDKLGLNRYTKIKDLRRKHLQAKRAKAKNRIALSSSFTSSVSYQDDLSEWSSATSQYLGSDAESIYNSQSAPEHEAISDQDKPAEYTDFNRATSDTNGYSGPIKTSFKRPKETAKSSEQDDVIATSQFLAMDVQQLPSQASTMESNSVLLSSSVPSLKEPHSVLPKLRQSKQQDYHSSSLELGHNDEINASVGLSTRSQPSSFWSPSRASLRTSFQASKPQKKKSQMGF